MVVDCVSTELFVARISKKKKLKWNLNHKIKLKTD